MGASKSLDERVIDAHAAQDYRALANLYKVVADEAAKAGHIDAACFHYTQAYVFALDGGESAIADEVRALLVMFGREE